MHTPIHNKTLEAIWLSPRLTFDFDVDEVRVDTQCHVAGQGPGRGGPGNHRHAGVLLQGEGYDHWQKQIRSLYTVNVTHCNMNMMLLSDKYRFFKRCSTSS